MIPNLFKKQKIPRQIPEELNVKIKDFSKNKNQEEFLKKSFMYIVKNWGGSRFNLLFKFRRLFTEDINIILNKKGYMHCTTMNYLLRIMMIKSNLFKEKDVKLKLTNSWLMIHQYLEIKLENKKIITLDPWNYQFGIDYGYYGLGFDTKKLYPIKNRRIN